MIPNLLEIQGPYPAGHPVSRARIEAVADDERCSDLASIYDALTPPELAIILAADPLFRLPQSVLFHGPKMRAARSLVRRAGYDLDEVTGELLGTAEPVCNIDCRSVTPKEWSANRREVDANLERLAAHLFHRPAHRRGGNPGKSVVGIDGQGKRTVYGSMTAAADELKVPVGNLWRAIKRGWRVHGSRFQMAA